MKVLKGEGDKPIHFDSLLIVCGWILLELADRDTLRRLLREHPCLRGNAE